MIKLLIVIRLFLATNTLSAQIYTIDEALDFYTKKDWGNAAKAYEFLTARNQYTGEYWYNLGNSYFYLQEYSKAKDAFIKSAETGQSPSLYVSVSYTMIKIASCYAYLNNKEEALSWFSKASKTPQGILPDIINNDTILRNFIGNEAEYKKLIAPVLPAGVDRNTGWQEDLKYMVNIIETRHYDPFSRISRQEWEQAITKLRERIPRLSDLEILGELLKLICLLHDGHSVFVPYGPSKYPAHQLPLMFYEFKEGIFIRAASEEYKEMAGARVVAIGGIPVEEVKQRMKSYVAHENDFLLKMVSCVFLSIPEYLFFIGCTKDTLSTELTIMQNGILSTKRVSAGTLDRSKLWGRDGTGMVRARDACTNPVPLYLKNYDSLYWFEYNKDRKLVYFQMNNVFNKPQQSLESFADSLVRFINNNAVNYLVIDLRLNTGGNTFLSYSLLHKIIACEKVNQKGKLFTIIGRDTYSAAMNFTSELDKHTNTIFVGEPTACSPNFTGEIVGYTLPYSHCWFSVSNIYWQGGINSNDCRRWIAPDITAELSIEDYKTNRDPCMEAILNYISH